MCVSSYFLESIAASTFLFPCNVSPVAGDFCMQEKVLLQGRQAVRGV